MIENNRNLEEEIAGLVTRNRKRLLGFGILAVILGIVGTYMSVAMTMVSILILCVFVIVVGVLYIIESFSAPEWKGKLLTLLIAITYVVAGSVMIIYPGASAVWFTLFIISFFIVIGVMRILAGFQAKDELSGWGWMVFSGVLNLALGIMIAAEWPESGLWVIGLFISIDMIIHGFNAIVLSRVVKEVQKEANR